MAIVTICNDFRAQEEEICHCFHNFPFYLPWRDGIGCHDCSIFSWISRQLCHSHLSPSSKGLLVVILCSSAVAYWTTFDLDGSSFSATSLWLFMQFMGFSWLASWSGLPFCPPIDHVLSELSSVTRPSWWSNMAWLIASLNYASLFAMTRQGSMKGEGNSKDI